MRNLPPRELRIVAGSVEVRADKPVADLDPSAPIPVTGHAAVFGQRTVIGTPLYGFVEEIDPRAFDDVLEGDTRYLINHDPSRIMARVANGTLRLSTDKVGLVSEADLAPVSYARDLAILMARGDVNQMSFAFRVGAGGDTWRTMEKDEAEAQGVPEGTELRTVTKVEMLYDVSAVTMPAYEGADVALRAAEEILGPRPTVTVGRSAERSQAMLIEAQRNATLLRVRMDAAYDGRPI